MFWKLLTAFIDGEACDPADFGRVYTDGELIPIEQREDEIMDKAEAFDILMGVTP